MDKTDQRRALRQKIAERRQQRTGGGSALTGELARRDPATALLSLGLDDPELLRNAKQIAKLDLQALKQVMNTTTGGDGDSSDDEVEAPPQ